jgi:hypothetical protein
LLFLERGEDAIVVSIEEAHDLMKGLAPVVIPEDVRVDGGVTVAKICGKLHFGVLCIIPTDKASNKAHNDDVPGGWVGYNRRDFSKRYCLALRDARCQENDHGEDKNKSGELPLPMVSNASSPGPTQRAI